MEVNSNLATSRYSGVIDYVHHKGKSLQIHWSYLDDL